MKLDEQRSGLELGILHTIAYFDVFAYPLTKDQLNAFLSYNVTTENELNHALDRLVEKKLIHTAQEYFYASTRTEVIVRERLRYERRASRMLAHARWISFFLKRVPFVRAVFITGSLSKLVAPEKSDIDYMIVTERNRLWICKMLLTGFRRFLLFNSKKYFCMNLMVTDKGLYFPLHNYYTAVEIATTKLVWNSKAFQKLQWENAWIREYLPNWRDHENGIRPLTDSPSVLQRWLEQGLSIFNLDRLNAAFMSTARKFWRRKCFGIDDAKFNSMIQCTPDISSVWYSDHQARIYEGYHQRLEYIGIEKTL